MLEAVERRFGTYRAPAVIDMLSDNGSPYIARDTQIFARQLGLKPCFTPVRSPQSNGISPGNAAARCTDRSRIDRSLDQTTTTNTTRNQG